MGIWAAAIGGLVVLVIACFEIRAVLRLRNRGLRTVSTVTETLRVRDGPSKTWVSVVVFTDNRGNRVETSLKTGRRKKPIGSTIPVVYLPGEAQKARQEHLYHLWYPIFVLLLFAAGMVVALVAQLLGLGT